MSTSKNFNILKQTHAFPRVTEYKYYLVVANNLVLVDATMNKRITKRRISPNDYFKK